MDGRWKGTQELRETLGAVLKRLLTYSSLRLFSTGSNSYCIDKNYAGILIVWDRMFGK